MQVQTLINGVDTDRLTETIEAIQETPALATFRFRAQNLWLSGGHNRSTITDYDGAGEAGTPHTTPFVLDADEPPVLLGGDEAANPVEFVLHALAACLTTSLAYHGAARGLAIESVESRLEGDLDLHGFLGLDDSVRRGFDQIHVTFRIEGDLTEAQKDELVQLGQTYSPVFDIVSHPVQVTVAREA